MHDGVLRGVRPFRTRHQLAEWAVDHLRARLAEGARVLFGIDAALGYPRGFATALARVAPDLATPEPEERRASGGVRVTITEPLGPPPSEPWLRTWRELDRLVHDGRDNASNRFEVAGAINAWLRAPLFWGAPAGADPRVPATRPAHEPLSRFRLTEERARAAGWQPKSVWQLSGAGAVGSQTLLAIPWACGLRDAMGGALQVWPFETGFSRAFPAPLVLAEIYPSLLAPGAGIGDAIPDQAQTEAAALALHRADADGRLATWLALPHLDPSTAAAATAEEGWLLGVT